MWSVYPYQHFEDTSLTVSDFLSPVQEGVKGEIGWKDETSDEDDEPEEPVLEGEEGGEDVVDAMDSCMVWVLFDCIQENPFLHRDLLFLPAHLCKQTNSRL